MVRLSRKKVEQCADEIEAEPEDLHEAELNRISFHLGNSDQQAEIYFKQIQQELVTRAAKRVQKLSNDLDRIGGDLLTLESMQRLNDKN